MPRVKWDIDGKGVTAAGGQGGYSGPDLPKGSYVAKVKRMTLGRIKSQGANHNKPRISVLLEVCGPESAKQYFGAPVWDGLNIIDSSVPFVNAFLHGLTNGSDSEKKAVESAFWPPNGPMTKKEANKAGDEVIHITKIGKYNINSPQGEQLVQITVRAGRDLSGNYRPEISGYLPYDGPKPSVDDDENDSEDWVIEDDDDDDEIEDDTFDDEEDDDDDELEEAESVSRSPF